MKRRLDEPRTPIERGKHELQDVKGENLVRRQGNYYIKLSINSTPDETYTHSLVLGKCGMGSFSKTFFAVEKGNPDKTLKRALYILRTSRSGDDVQPATGTSYHQLTPTRTHKNAIEQYLGLTISQELDLIEQLSANETTGYFLRIDMAKDLLGFIFTDQSKIINFDPGTPYTDLHTESLCPTSGTIPAFPRCFRKKAGENHPLSPTQYQNLSDHLQEKASEIMPEALKSKIAHCTFTADNKNPDYTRLLALYAILKMVRTCIQDISIAPDTNMDTDHDSETESDSSSCPNVIEKLKSEIQELITEMDQGELLFATATGTEGGAEDINKWMNENRKTVIARAETLYHSILDLNSEFSAEQIKEFLATLSQLRCEKIKSLIECANSDHVDEYGTMTQLKKDQERMTEPGQIRATEIGEVIVKEVTKDTSIHPRKKRKHASFFQLPLGQQDEQDPPLTDKTNCNKLCRLK